MTALLEFLATNAYLKLMASVNGVWLNLSLTWTEAPFSSNNLTVFR